MAAMSPAGPAPMMQISVFTALFCPVLRNSLLLQSATGRSFDSPFILAAIVHEIKQSAIPKLTLRRGAIEIVGRGRDAHPAGGR
jgi:hypothetical protein